MAIRTIREEGDEILKKTSRGVLKWQITKMKC